MNLWSIVDFIYDLVDWSLNWRKNVTLVLGLVLAGVALHLIPNAVWGYVVAGLVFVGAWVLGSRWNNG